MEKISRAVTDLAMAAYVKMHGFKCIGRRNKNFYFELEETDIRQFEQLRLDYVNSPFLQFDSEIMALKKIGEFVSTDV